MRIADRHQHADAESDAWDDAHQCGNQQSEESQLLEMLDMLQRDYAKAAKPYINLLTEIRSRREPPPLIVTMEQAKALHLWAKQ